MNLQMFVLVADLKLLAVAAALALAYALIGALRRRFTRGPMGPAPARSTSDILPGIVLGAAALFLAFSAMIRLVLPNTLNTSPEPFGYDWWRFSTELLFANASLAVVFLVLVLRRTKPDVPVAPIRRRTWRTYLNLRLVWVPGATLAALTLLAAFTGSISRPDDQGIYRWLVIEVYGRTLGATDFLGWAYGLPLIASGLALGVLTILALHANAVRPFHRPEAIPADEATRRANATRILWFVSGALLLSLGRSMGLLAGSSRLTTSNPNGSWGTSIAALDPWLWWTGTILTGCAYTFLLLVAGSTRFVKARSRARG